jgi:hypothetical protein
MLAGGPINGTFSRWANKWYTYPILIIFLIILEEKKKKKVKMSVTYRYILTSHNSSERVWLSISLNHSKENRIVWLGSE